MVSSYCADLPLPLLPPLRSSPLLLLPPLHFPDSVAIAYWWWQLQPIAVSAFVCCSGWRRVVLVAGAKGLAARGWAARHVAVLDLGGVEVAGPGPKGLRWGV